MSWSAKRVELRTRLVLNLLAGGALLLPACRAAGQNRAPADDVLWAPTWRFGADFAGGFAPSYQIRSLLDYTEQVEFFQGSFVVGRILTRARGRGFVRGRAEALTEITPFWLVHEPRQVDTIMFSGVPNESATATFPGYTTHGASTTPVLIRWNFARHPAPRVVPWGEAGAGLLWTAQRFPQGYTYAPGGRTSRINFTPQLGAGASFFVRRHASVDAGARLTFMESAGIGEYNPGVTVLHFTIGYSWYR